MKPAVILTNLIAVTAALRIPSRHSTQSIVVLETDDIEVACSIFCIGLIMQPASVLTYGSQGGVLLCRLSVTGSQEIVRTLIIGAQTRAASLIVIEPLIPENEANADSFAHSENTRPRLS
ncbi:hypothetical protein K456DRAFT_34570 [Colletotrichum gloeosporioides 23]|nr:hypothetical protein K456DRAFT_34570 [Colletotrichum gloeosporioides 23]